ncbi:MAG: hypothetical protein V4686_01295 [Patescibacteria group bacterium]
MEQQLLLDLEGVEHQNGIYTITQGKPSEVIKEALENSTPEKKQEFIGSNI